MRSWNLEFQLLHLYIEKSTFPNKKSWMAELAKAPVFYHAEGCGFDPHDRRIPFLLHFCPRVHPLPVIPAKSELPIYYIPEDLLLQKLDF